MPFFLLRVRENTQSLAEYQQRLRGAYYSSLVVRAADTEEAREVALHHTDSPLWKDSKITSCRRVSDAGQSKLILAVDVNFGR